MCWDCSRTLMARVDVLPHLQERVSRLSLFDHARIPLVAGALQGLVSHVAAARVLMQLGA